jgi:quinol-cytochrome oxidoreductase complex cytochrome b subunit
LEETEKKEDNSNQPINRLVGWVDSRIGLSHEVLRPLPTYSLNPFYWLGALTVVAFLIQGITGVIMMLYYVPSPDSAYSSTLYIFQNVNYGTFLETIHLYTAYAMIMLAFMHMMRGYFVSAHKKPRELMWMVGMAMGFLTLGFGFTGYLLPWTVVSKSATDVGIGMIQALPPQVASFLQFLIVGAGGNATELLRFYDLHVVVLPAVLLVLLGVKMYMLESHGISDTVIGGPLPEKKRRLVPVFPDATFYVLELSALFGSAMLLISVIFPLHLQPEYSPQAAAQLVAQPDWYFLWIYQVLKIAAFEGPNIPIALSIVTLVFIALTLLPFIDRSSKRRIAERPLYVALGAILVAEVATLAYWGLVTPGEVIPTWEAGVLLGSIALAILGFTFAIQRLFLRQDARQRTPVPMAKSTRTFQIILGGIFTVLLGAGALAIGKSIDMVVVIALSGATLVNVGYLLLYIVGLGVTVGGTVYFLHRLRLFDRSSRSQELPANQRSVQ